MQRLLEGGTYFNVLPKGAALIRGRRLFEAFVALIRGNMVSHNIIFLQTVLRICIYNNILISAFRKGAAFLQCKSTVLQFQIHSAPLSYCSLLCNGMTRKTDYYCEKWLLVEFSITNQPVERGVNSGRKLPQIVIIKIFHQCFVFFGINLRQS